MSSIALLMKVSRFIPAHVKPWMYWMQVLLFALPIFFVGHTSVQILILGQLLNGVVGYTVFVREGQKVSRLFGLGHIFWAPPMWVLAKDVFSDEWIGFRAYAAAASVTIAISLVVDVRDWYLWLRGERESVLTGIPEGHPLEAGNPPALPVSNTM